MQFVRKKRPFSGAKSKTLYPEKYTWEEIERMSFGLFSAIRVNAPSSLPLEARSRRKNLRL